MKRTVHKKGLFAVIFGGISLVLAIAFVFGSYSFRLSEAEINEKIKAKLPLESAGATISDVAVLLDTENLVTLTATGDVAKLGATYSFTIAATGEPAYNFVTGEFYFRPTDITLHDVGQIGGETLTTKIDTVSTFAKKLFPKRDEVIDELAHASTVLAPEIESWLKDKAEVAAVYVLTKTPIYTLPNDAKGIAAQAVLQSVTVEDNHLVVTLSLYRLGVWVLFFGAVALISFGLVISGAAPLFVFASVISS